MSMPWWLVALTAVGGLVVGLLMSSRSGLLGKLFGAKIEVVKAEARAKELQAEHGAMVASARLMTEHQAALSKMDDVQRAQAEQLRADPVALSRFLVNAGK